MEKSIFTIGEFEHESGVSVRTLRYYYSIGLLIPSDYSEGGNRLYSKDDLTLLKKIKLLQFLGFPLKDFKDMLEKNIVEGGILLKSLNFQRNLFEARRLEIINILSDLSHMIDVVKSEKLVNIEVFCAMLQKLMFEEDTEKWFKEHFSINIVDTIFNVNKSEEINLDKRWTKVLSEIKQLSFNEVSPYSNESQETIEVLLKLMDETVKGKLELIEEKLPTSEPLAFSNPFTEKEQEFLKIAMEIYKNNNLK
ncbi:MerR family transcriptional regulator [Bacillus sp. Bva_UNVM-123]|uniref:MerR family transcriptional regulator n=1 Tax=Bacillus sp. Bva_UNVM-123 TaxID=2829798 RepID=UPI00391F60C9